MSLLYVSVGAVGLCAVVQALCSAWRQRGKRYPPGPPPYPVIGNLPHISMGWSGPSYVEWGKKYGPIMYFRVPGRHILVLNRLEDTINLFDKRGSQYSHRPYQYMAHELAGRKVTVLFSPYGERLRQYRRMISTVASPRAAEKWWPLHTAETHKLLGRLLHSPADFERHVRQLPTAVAMQMVYGYTVSDSEDYFVRLVRRVAKITTTASEPGRWLVDSFRWLSYVPAWFPGAGFKRIAKDWRADMEQSYEAPLAMVKQRLRDGSASPCFVVDQLEDRGNLTDDIREEYVKYAAAGLYTGGTDSSSSFLLTFMLFMTLYPEAQKRAQAELDSVIGRDRLPTIQDKAHLPYMECLTKEIHRIHPVACLLPRSTRVEDLYQGFTIPAGCAVLANIWAFSRDKTMYPEPDEFRPERFEGEKGKTVVDPREFTFGLGRRRCPGIALADSLTFIFMTSILSVFDILKPIDESGNEYTPPFEFEPTLTSAPKPFQCRVVPRAESARSLILGYVGERTV